MDAKRGNELVLSVPATAVALWAKGATSASPLQRTATGAPILPLIPKHIKF